MADIKNVVEGIQNDVIRRLEHMGEAVSKTKIKNLVNDYVEQALIAMSNDDVVIYGLCMEYQKNKNIY